MNVKNHIINLELQQAETVYNFVAFYICKMQIRKNVR
jgi:hypothetical protein